MDDIPIFEKAADGRLVRVRPEDAERRCAGRSVSLEISREHGRRLVLLSPEDVAAQKAEWAEREAALAARGKARAGAVSKLKALGLTDDEIAALKE